MNQRPKIKEALDVFPVAENHYQVWSSETMLALKGGSVGGVFEKLLPYLDGQHTVAEIIADLEGAVSPPLVRKMIAQLLNAGILEDAADPQMTLLSAEEREFYREHLAFFGMITQDMSQYQIQLKLKQARAAVIAHGSLGTLVARSLARSGVGVIWSLNPEEFNQPDPVNPFVQVHTLECPLDSPETVQDVLNSLDTDVVMVAGGRHSAPLLQWCNDACLARDVPLMICLVSGSEGIVGPFVIPHQTACYKCYDLRVKSNTDFFQEQVVWEKWVKEHPATQPDVANLWPLKEAVAGLASLEVIKHLTGIYQPETYGRFLAIDGLTLEATAHDVLKLPRCPQCSPMRERPSHAFWKEPAGV